MVLNSFTSTKIMENNVKESDVYFLCYVCINQSPGQSILLNYELVVFQDSLIDCSILRQYQFYDYHVYASPLLYLTWPLSRSFYFHSTTAPHQ